MGDATAWLKSQTDSNGLLPGFGSAPSISATADFAKSLDELGSADAASVAMSVKNAAAAALTDDHRSSQESAEGAWASQTLGSQDDALVDDVDSHIAQGGEALGGRTADAAALGRLYDSTFNAYTGTDAQAWAVLALAKAAAPSAGEALTYLLGQQCTDGGFRTKFSDVDATGQTCAADAGSTDPDLTSSSPDATGTAVIFLSALPAKDATVTDALERAVDWLTAHQDPSGSFSEYYGVSGNSTGIAGRALRLSDKIEAATKAATWLRRHQAAPVGVCASPLDGDRGALSYDDDTYAANRTDGLADAFALGSAISVTAQSLAALAALPAGNPVPTLTQAAPVVPGARVSINIVGANAGDALCLSIGGGHQLLAAGATSATVTAPTGVASTPFSVQTASGAAATGTLRINTATRLGVAAPKKIKRGKRVRVVVRGLWAGERVTVKLGKKRLGSAVANTAGTATLRKKVAKKTKTGRKAITVTGRFTDRVGKRNIRVVR
ncbi:prenyltransferase/squalene oxidase repeat-containing protein [Nocardioides terrae]|uniref:prenyltransferase/squalene oxidase repeat-containing protein n=1 Tax=Nocardioides terrae TaxID=574651 RepID=UPI000B879B8B|nr:prenyltransferase/squalene oxidase repeat-containing protein [Nocardioides terrae]